jgi:hypothetical protein
MATDQHGLLIIDDHGKGPCFEQKGIGSTGEKLLIKPITRNRKCHVNMAVPELLCCT